MEDIDGKEMRLWDDKPTVEPRRAGHVRNTDVGGG